MHSKICMVTGATSGIGAVTAHVLAQQGATVIVVGRDAAKSAATVNHIKQQTGNLAVEFVLADLSSQKEIHQLAQQFTSRYQRLHVLVNNAGALFSARQQSVDGIEMTFAPNHLNYFLLTNLLLDTLKASAQAHSAPASSTLARRRTSSRAVLISTTCRVSANIPVGALMGSPSCVTCCSLMNWRGGWRGGGGLMPLFNRLMSVAMLRPEQGAQTSLYLATSPEVEGVSGKYFVNRKAVRSSKASYDQSATDRLWQVSAAMTGLSA